MDALITFTTEVDTLKVALEAFNQGFISRKDLKALTAIDPKVSMVERRRALLKHVQTSLEEKLLVFSKHSSESEIEASAVQAYRERLIKVDVCDHLKSLQNSEVPYSMRCRYLLQFVHRSVSAKPNNFIKRVLEVVPFGPIEEDPLKFAKDAQKNNLIDKPVLDHFINKCPRGRTQHNFHRGYKSELKRLVDLEVSQLKNFVKEIFSFTIPSSIVADSLIDPKQLSKVYELLVTYAYNWRNIGIALKFQPQDLRNIQATPLLLQDAPKSYLSRLLEDWLLKELKHTLPPSVHCLKQALNSQIVGLGSLADEIDKINLCEGSFQAVLNPSYCSINVESAFQNCDAVYVKEGSSTLLEIQTAQHEARTYQWLKDGEKLTSDSSTEPILSVHQGDIDWDGCELSCKISPMTTTSVPGITINVSCALDQYRSSLASTYLFQPEVPEDTWPPVADLKYINLALVKQKRIDYNSKCARLTIRGDVDDILLDKQIIKYNDKEFFKSMSSGKLILIEGRPGSGKTTFVHKLAQDWAIKSGGAIRLLLLVSLRVLNTFGNPDLSDILKLFENLQVSKDIIEQRFGKGVCFIFDGFDEFSPQDEKSSVVHKIINKTYLNRSIVIVASRPAAIAKLRHKADIVIEVVGFLNEQIMEYFKNYPFSTPTKSEELKLYLESHPNIFHMCYLPIHATMVAFLFQKMGKVPTTETEMYTHFTRLTLIRNLTKNREFEPVNIDLHSLTGEECLCFKQICLLAFEKTLSSKQVLDQNEVDFHFQVQRSIDSSLGLITVDRTAGLYGYKNIYTFMHLTFQEYLAAYHITTLSDEEQMKLIQEYGDKNHMLVVWKFYCGLIKIKPLEKKFKSLLCKSADNTLFQIQCAYEAQERIACAQLLKSVNYHFHLKDEYLSTPDFTALGYIANTNTTSISTKLSLLNCNMNVEAIDALLSEMKNKARDSIYTLHIETEIADDSQLECFVKLLINLKHLKALSLEAEAKLTHFPEASDIDDIELLHPTELLDIEPLLTYVDLTSLHYKGNNYKSLVQHSKHLDISARDICDEGAAKFTCLPEASNIELLNLTELVLINVGIEPLLSDSSFANLSSIRYKGNNYKSLVSRLKHCKHLVKLDISGNGIGDEGAKDLAENLKHWRINLQIIDIARNGIKSSGVVAIYESLRHSYLMWKPTLEMPHIKEADVKKRTDLRSLVISINNHMFHCDIFCKYSDWEKLHNPDPDLPLQLSSMVDSSEELLIKNCENSSAIMKKLTFGLEKCPNVRKLHLCSNNIIFGCELLRMIHAELSKSSRNLKELTISFSQIDDVVLSLSPRWFPNLVKLCLPSNNISSLINCNSLAASLPYCSRLEKLDLEDNLIDSGGANMIVLGLKSCKHFQELNLLRNPCHNITVNQEITFSVKLSHGVVIIL